MNRTTIEQTLRRAPAVKTPAALREQLRETIELPPNITPREMVRSRWSWIPALGFALWFLGCMVVLGIHSNWFAETKTAPQSTEQATSTTTLAPDTSAAELAQLEKDFADAERLRAEVQRLRAELAEFAKLREQNTTLRAELAQRNASNSSASPQQDFFAMAFERTVRVQCINNMKQVCLVARIWANESKTDALPDRVTLGAAIKQQMPTGSLQCPADPTATVEVLSPGASEARPELVYIRCSKHHCVGLVDGSAHLLVNSSTQVVQRDGLWVLQRAGK